MTSLADSARRWYARALGYSEGVGSEFFVGPAEVQRAAVRLNPIDASSRFVLGTLLWRASVRGEGRVDTLVAKEARAQLACARTLAMEGGSDRLIASADSVIERIEYFLAEERARSR